MAGEEKENKRSNKLYVKNNPGSKQPLKYSTPPSILNIALPFSTCREKGGRGGPI